MRLSHFDAFAPLCPVCRQSGRGLQRLVLATVALRTEAEIIGGMLHCINVACQHEYPIIDGIPVVVPDVRGFLNERSVEIMMREDFDPALESLLGDALGPDSWYGVLRQTLSTYIWDAYGDFDPQEPAPALGTNAPGAALRCLHRLLALVDPVVPAARVLDVGCGGGRTSFAVAAHLPDGLVLGIDANPALLRAARAAGGGEVAYARRRIGVAYDRRRIETPLPGADRVDFWACDALALPFGPGSADMIVALNLLDCLPEPRRLLAEFAQLLAPRGLALMATPYDWSTRATPMETWIGGHSQRGPHGGAAEPFLRSLLQAGAHEQSVPELAIVAEQAEWPWATRLHDRAAVHYSSHLFALEKSGA